MQLSTKSPATRTALTYITIGAVMIVWTIIWIVWLYNNPPHSSHAVYYVCAGFLCTGLTVLLIGISMGSIGRASRDAETPNVVMSPAPAHVAAPPVVVPNPVPATNGTIDSTGAVVTSAPQVVTVSPTVPDAAHGRATVLTGSVQTHPQG